MNGKSCKSCKSSLLKKINSKYILKKILSLAYANMKSVFRLSKYNKCLLSKLDINFEDYFKYEIEISKKDIVIDFGQKDELMISLPFFWFVIFLIYIILFYKRGTFNNEILKEGYNKKKKKFVDIMDNYILLSYFLFDFATFLILFFLERLIRIKAIIKVLIYLFIILINFTHYISFIIKFVYEEAIIKTEFMNIQNKGPANKTQEAIKENDKISKLLWFHTFDIFIMLFESITVLAEILVVLMLIKDIIYIFKFEEIKKFFLIKFKGINIIKKELLGFHNNLNKKQKNILIFKKEYIEEFEYELNDNQINLIKKINDIRKNNHIPLLEYDKIESLPEFIINEKTQLIFNYHENIFGLSENYYVFKYRINEFQNFLNNNQILNIINIETLDTVNVVEQNNCEFISIYDSINLRKNYNKIPNIHIDINNNINIINTDDKLNEGAERDNEKSEIPIIRNVKINNFMINENN